MTSPMEVGEKYGTKAIDGEILYQEDELKALMISDRDEGLIVFAGKTEPTPPSNNLVFHIIRMAHSPLAQPGCSGCKRRCAPLWMEYVRLFCCPSLDDLPSASTCCSALDVSAPRTDAHPV